jgi:hypothetical protein
MWKSLGQAIARHGRWLRRRTGMVCELLHVIAAKRERYQRDSCRSVARARFWADLREGQRQAEAHSSRQDP